MMDVLLAVVIALGARGAVSPLKGQITSALRQMPTLTAISKLAPELGNVLWMGESAVPMVRQGAPTRCRFCSQEFR